jgi:DNA-binding beta-propeller fold protein YncE
MVRILTIVFTLISWFTSAQKAEIAFMIKEKDLIPEGIAYDPAGKDFYLSSINKRKVVKVSPQGNVTDFVSSGSHGMLQSLGMRVSDDGKLWVCNNSPEEDSIKIANVHVFDLETGKLVKKVTLSDGKPHLFNDMVFHSDGFAYVTDSEGGSIYRISKTTFGLEEFKVIRPGSYPNGIALSPDEKKLIVSTGSEMGIVAIDLASKEMRSIAHEKFFILGADGLYRYKNVLIGVQNVTYPEAILQYNVSTDFSSIQSITTLVSHHPAFDSPTTGVIVDDYFYFIANSQLFQIVGNKGKLKKPDELKDVIILRVELD